MSELKSEPFTPSEKRGASLLREILDLIEHEVSVHAAGGDQRRAGRWNQQSWGETTLAAESLVELEALGHPEFADELAVPARLVAQSCGTTACVAGHAALLAGDSPVVLDTEVRTLTVSWHQVVSADGPRAGQIMEVDDRAAELLELSFDDACDLFAYGNSLEDVRRIAGRILAEAGA